MATILIFGERGQVATALARVYAGRHDGVRCVGRATADIADRAAVDATVAQVSPDLVINAAAYTAVDKAEDEEGAATHINRGGAAHVAEAADPRDHHPFARPHLRLPETLVDGHSGAEDRSCRTPFKIVWQATNIGWIGQRIFREAAVHGVAAVQLGAAQRLPPGPAV